MSPVSRGRKGMNKNKRRSTRLTAVPAQRFDEPCDCPACTGDVVDPDQLIDSFLAPAADLVDADDPIDGELLGAMLLTVGAAVGPDFAEAVTVGLIPAFEARATRDALTVLTAISSVQDGPAGVAAAAAADRLLSAGVPRQPWSRELESPLIVTDGLRLTDRQRTMSVLACRFERAGRTHGFIMSVDHDDCDAASNLVMIDGEEFQPSIDRLVADARVDDVSLTSEKLDPAELRWQVEAALDARAVHDNDNALAPGIPAEFDDDGPSYSVLAALLRARMRTLPESRKPKPVHGDLDFRRSALPALGTRLRPSKRNKADGPAPVYQIKVGLRGAKPPIWRRLEVPADITLARLHTVIQYAFAWENSHLHVFETPYGDFGIADRELGHAADSLVTLEQVAPTVKSTLRYTYDFGDNWEHDILVEKVVDRDPATTYPRCTGGRRAAPPEDCGGIWGYAELLEVLADPTHPEHDNQLEWLDLDDPTDFDPAEFSAEAVNKSLSVLAEAARPRRRART